MAKRDFDDEEGFFETLMKHRGKVPMPDSMSKMLKIIVSVVVLTIIGLVTWAVWPSGGKVAEDSLPVVRADSDDYKVRPDEPGGMPIPNKDSTVFESMDSQDSGDGKVENLLEDQERPMKKGEVFEDTADSNSEDTPSPTVTPTDEAKLDKAVKEEAAEEKPNVIDTLKEEAGTKKKEKAPAKTVSKGSVYIQLAAVKSEADTKAKWAKLQSMYPSLKPLSMRSQKADLGAKGVFYRVQAGPLSSSDASALCAKIKAAKGDCILAK